MYPSKIILHHSLTKDGATVNWTAIRKWHKGENPDSPHKWDDIGYHYGIELVGDNYEILLGRLMTEVGAHTRGQNRSSVGICLVGNFDDVPPPRRQWDLAIRLVKSLCEILYITGRSVYGHREFASYKSCPGNAFDTDRFRNEVDRR